MRLKPLLILALLLLCCGVSLPAYGLLSPGGGGRTDIMLMAPNITATKPYLNGTTINLSWDVPGSTSTFILKRIFNEGTETTVNASIPSTTTSYSQTGLADGAYIYTIYAVPQVGSSIYMSRAGSSDTLTIDTTVQSYFFRLP